jgi:hypothetical protein
MKKIGIIQPLESTTVLSDAPTSEQSIERQSTRNIMLPDVTSIDISKLQSLEQKFKTMKQSHKSSDFVSRINSVLDLFEPDEIKYSHEVVLFVMAECEKFLLIKGSGAQKKEIVTEICKKYFNNDDALVKLIIELVFHRLPQVKIFGRIVSCSRSNECQLFKI